MKKIIAITWFIICLIPAGGKADESVVNSKVDVFRQSSVADGQQSCCDSLQSEEKVIDEELQQVVGHGFDGLSPWVEKFPRKTEIVSSRIKLWDEADRGIMKIESTGLGIIQSITLPVTGSR